MLNAKGKVQNVRYKIRVTRYKISRIYRYLATRILYLLI